MHGSVPPPQVFCASPHPGVTTHGDLTSALSQHTAQRTVVGGTGWLGMRWTVTGRDLEEECLRRRDQHGDQPENWKSTGGRGVSGALALDRAVGQEDSLGQAHRGRGTGGTALYMALRSHNYTPTSQVQTVAQRGLLSAPGQRG